MVGRAAQFDPDVAPFAAVGDGDGWADLRDLIGPTHATVVVDVVPIPDDWVVEMRIPAVQLVADVTFEPVELPVEELGQEHAEEALALIAQTQPGPFGSRTLELGGFVGVRDDDGVLVAMAGERFQLEGFGEVSGVCTLPSQRSRGLGGALTRLVGRRMQERGDTPFLHASATNTTAIRLYDGLGFALRCEVDFVVVRAPA